MASVLDIIKHYQQAIEKYSEDEGKVLRCIDKLFHLKVTVQHLQETGVGRTVNALRKEPGEVGQAARALVLKWKTMVAAEESDQEGDHKNDTPTQNGHSGVRDSDDHIQQSQSSNDQYNTKISTPKTNHTECKEMNGHHSGSKRKYNSSEEEDDAKKKSRHTSSSEDDHKQQVVIKKEKLSDSDSSDDSESSDSDSDSYSSESSRDEVKVKTEIKQEFKKEKESPDRDRPSSKHSHSNNSDHKKESSSSKRHDSHSHHKSTSKDERRSSVTSSKSSSHKHKSSHEKENSHKSESDNKGHKSDMSDKRHKSSSDEKRHKSDTSSDEKKESKSSSKHSSEKHKSSSHKHESSSERHKSSSDKHSSKDHKSSSHTDKVPNKHKSSSEKEIKHKSRDSTSSSKEKQSSSSKDKTKERSSSSKERSSHHSEKKHSSRDSKSHSSDKSKHRNDDVNSEKKSKDKSNSSSHKSKSSISSSKSKEDVPKKKIKISNSEDSGEDGIDCGSGASFAEALGMISPTKSKKKIRDVNSPNNSFNNDLSPAALLAPSAKLAPLPALEISALPEISPNYKPRPPPKLMPHFTDEDAISAGISSKNQRTKVYSGNKVFGKITSLYEMCVHVLQEHIDALEYTGGVPYDILKPVVDRASPQQLYLLEHYNPYLMDDTDHLWKNFCNKNFRNKKRQELESWREMYMRCQEEQEHKLKSLTANIRLTQEAKKAPIKQTKMAYVDSVVKPPRNIARKQAQHGTAHAATASPAARVASLSTTAGVLKTGSPRPPPAASVSASAFNKPKKAPLMAKALQFMRGRKR